MPVQSLPYILILGTLYGTTLLAGRFIIGHFEPVTFIGLRLVMASIGFLLMILFTPGRSWPRGKENWKHGLFLSVFGTAVPMILLTTSLKYQSSGITGILITLGPCLTVLMAHFLLPGEQLNRRKLLGVAIAFSGVILLMALGENGLPNMSQASPIGYLLVILAITSGSTATIYVRKYMQGMDTVSVATIRVILAALLVMPLAYSVHGLDFSQVNMQSLVALGWAALAGTFLAVWVAFDVIQRFGATAGALATYITPIVASIGGVLLLDERISAGMLCGMAMILMGIFFINQHSLRPDLAAKV